MLVGIPTAIVAGLINIDWNGGKPSLSIDRQRAAEIRNVARDQYNNFETQGGLQHLGQAATDLLSHAQGYASQNYSQQGYNAPGYGQPITYTQSQPSTANRNSSAAFPSTQPNQQHAQQQVLPNAQQDWRNYTPSTVPHNASNYNAPATNQGYATQATNQTYSPSDTRTLTYQQQEQLYQQQLQQQQLQQQQQLYDQQLKQYQYQQWLAQQASTQQVNTQQASTQQASMQQASTQNLNMQTGTQPSANQAPANYGTPQTDAYGRPVTTGYPPTNSQQTQYGQQNGQQNYNQGSLPAANSRGRY